MARLRIGVEQLGAQGFRLDLEGNGGAKNVVALAPGGGIRGTYEQDERAIFLREIRAETLVVSELAWALTRGDVRGSARLHDVEIDATLAVGAARGTRPAFVGTIRAARAEADLDLHVGTTTLHAATVRLSDFELVADDAGTVSLRIGEAAASTVRGKVGDIDLDLSDVALPDAVRLRDGAWRFERIDIGTIDARRPDLAVRPRAANADPARPSGPPAWLPVLDHLAGRFEVDLTTDVTLPILGHREATHRFRIPIEDGAIDFRRLEKSLATLENLVLDFELEDDKLILEKDIPLVPFDNKPLVEWPLDADGLALARRDRVRLAVLARPRLPAAAKTEADAARAKTGRAVQLRRLEVEGLDLTLSTTSPFQLPLARGRLAAGTEAHPAVGELRVRGRLRHVAQESPPGEVTVSGADLHARLDDLALGARRLSVGTLQLSAIERIHLAFAGLRPTAIDARLAGLRLDKLDLDPQP